jgi:hypothetical protein
MDFKVVFTETFCSDLEEILEHIAAVGTSFGVIG